LKVVFINHMSSNYLGGSELSLLSVIDRWTDRDRNVIPIVVTPTPGGAIAKAIRSRGWRAEVIPYSGWAVFDQEGGAAQARLRERDNARATLRLIELLRESRPELVVTNTLVAPWGALAAAVVGIPHAWFVREFGDAAQGFHFPDGRDRALRDLGDLSVTVFANSVAVRNELKRFVPVEKLRVAYPWVDLDQVRSLADEPLTVPPFAENAGLRIAVVGRIDGSKGQWRVIESIGRLAALGLRVDACFVGETLHRGGDRILRRRAARLGVGDRIRFVGEQDNPFAFMAAAELCVTPSDREAFGRATLEALAVGRPVLASNTGGSVELVGSGVNGELFDPDDIDDLVQLLAKFCLDPQRAESMRVAARLRADYLMTATLDVDDVIDTLEATRAAPSAIVPEHRRFWLESLEKLAIVKAPKLLRLFAGQRRWGRRFSRVLRDPRPAVRRRLGRN
jgi:glycosyltransferase involved in cell wall biosynthesis